MSIDVLASRYAGLKAQIDLKEAELKSLKDERDMVEAALIDQFSTTGISKVTINDLLIYTQKTLRASYDCSSTPAQAALKAAGLAYLLEPKVNANSFTAWVREQEKLKIALPESVLKYAKINEYREVRARKA